MLKIHLHSVDYQWWLSGRNSPTVGLIVRVELLERLQDQLAALPLQLGKGEIDCPRVAQFLHLPTELCLFHRETSKLTDDTAGLKANIVDKDPAKEVKCKTPSAQ